MCVKDVIHYSMKIKLLGSKASLLSLLVFLGTNSCSKIRKFKPHALTFHFIGMVLANLVVNLKKTNRILTALVEVHISSAVCAHTFTIIHDFPYSPTKQILYDILSLTLCLRFEVEINLQT